MKLLIPALVVLLLFIFPSAAEADHQTFLPYAGQTWLANQIRNSQEQVWCVDSRAEAYPQFVSQVRETNDSYTRLTGIKHRQVAFGDSACQVRHLMAPNFPCGTGAAACIYYANSPVDVHYQETLGFTDWRSAVAHELGHGLFQLHEQYIDSGGRIQCDYRPWTVMSCGPPYVREPQPRDIDLGCQMIRTSWCGMQPVQDCTGHYSTSHPWMLWQPCLVNNDGSTGRWLNTVNRFSVDVRFDEWYDPKGILTFGTCNGDRLRWDLKNNQWARNGYAFFKPEENFWSEMPLC